MPSCGGGDASTVDRLWSAAGGAARRRAPTDGRPPSRSRRSRLPLAPSYPIPHMTDHPPHDRVALPRSGPGIADHVVHKGHLALVHCSDRPLFRRHGIMQRRGEGWLAVHVMLRNPESCINSVVGRPTLWPATTPLSGPPLSPAVSERSLAATRPAGGHTSREPSEDDARPENL